MDAEKAKSLKHNSLWQDFVKDLNADIETLKEEISTLDIAHIEDNEVIRRYSILNERIRTIRLIIAKPDVIIEQQGSESESE